MATTSGSGSTLQPSSTSIQNVTLTSASIQNVTLTSTSTSSKMAAGSTSKTSVNSRSTASVSSSEGSNGGHGGPMDKPEMGGMTQDVKMFKESLANLKNVFNQELDETETSTMCHERLGEMLKILRSIMERYPPMQSHELVQAAGFLISQVKEMTSSTFHIDYPDSMFQAVDALAISFTDRLSEYMAGDLDTTSSTRVSEAFQAELLEFGDLKVEESFGPAQIDNLLMRHHQGVDHALKYAKIWAKYAKDIVNYIEKRTNLELEWARGMTKLAQATRPILKEESYLPFQSVYCTAMDQDLEMCASIHETCVMIQGNKFIEPLSLKRSEHQKTRKFIKDRWTRELKVLQETVSNLKKAKSSYRERCKEHERCREAVRMAEQAVELGATGENNVDRRRKLEEEALQRMEKSKVLYKTSIDEANVKHRQLLEVKAEVLQQIRELILQCDQTVKSVTVSYFQMQHKLSLPVAVKLQSLHEQARSYEPGSQFTEFVRFGLGEPLPPSRFSTGDPFTDDTDDNYLYFNMGHRQQGANRRTSVPPVEEMGSEEMGTSGSYRSRVDRASAVGPLVAWTQSIGPIEASDSDSGDSHESRDTSPSASPMIPSRQSQGGMLPPSEEVDLDNVAALSGDHDPSQGEDTVAPQGVQRRSFAISRAAKTHKLRRLITPSKCRECDSYVFKGLDCQDCGLSAHKRCLEVLLLRCGHKRLPAKIRTFAVDLGQHLLESGSQIPPVICKCVSEIDKRGLKQEGIYRKSGAKTKIEKLIQMFEIAPELVELGDVQLYAIADLLRLYFRELPDPLITFQLLPEFIGIAKTLNSNEKPESQAVQELSELCRKLPKPHFRTLAFLMHHLLRVATECEENNMTASNLAIVFSPTLMKTSEDSTSLSSRSYDDQNKVLELLILHANAIFGPPETVLPRDYAKYTSPATTSLEALGNAAAKRGVRSKSRKYGSSSGADLISSQTERRSIETHEEYHALPGHVTNEPLNVDYISDEDEDTAAEAIPAFLLPDDSSKTKKSPLLNRGSSPPTIIKASLKSFSGLEGVTPERLSTQDSLENAQRLSKQASADVMTTHSHPSSSRKSIPHDSSGSGIIRHHRTSETLLSRVGRAAKKHSLDEDFLSPPVHPPLSERLSSEPGFVSSPHTDATRNSPSPGADAVDGSGGGGTEVMRSSTSPSSGRTSLTIGIGSAGGGSNASSGSGSHPGRSSSLSDDHQASLSTAEQRRKFLASTSTDQHHSKGMNASMTSSQQPSMASSLPTNIPNLEENKVKIQVPGGIQSSSNRFLPTSSSVVRQRSLDKDNNS